MFRPRGAAPPAGRRFRPPVRTRLYPRPSTFSGLIASSAAARCANRCFFCATARCISVASIRLSWSSSIRRSCKYPSGDCKTRRPASASSRCRSKVAAFSPLPASAHACLPASAAAPPDPAQPVPPRSTASPPAHPATKSEIVTSGSWPTAEITGISDAKMARATRSSLNAQRSSIDPPPRPVMSTSATLCALA